MDFTTQIGGMYRPENQALLKVKEKLSAIGVDVRHPVTDPTMWPEKEVEMNYYESIAASDFHVVCNEPKAGLIPPDTADAMLYAILKNKPIILLRPPKYETDVDDFTRGLLISRGQLFHIYDLVGYNEAELQALLHGIVEQKIKYNLSPEETKHIRERVANYLQSLSSGD